MLSENVKKKFLPYGTFVEPFTVDGFEFDFFGNLETSLVHTTFFMKDYEIRSFLYIFGRSSSKKLTVKAYKGIWNSFLKVSRKLLKTPENHYLSTFILLLEAKTVENGIEEIVKTSFTSKSIWFGLRGSYNCGTILLENGEMVYPEELKSYLSWLFKS